MFLNYVSDDKMMGGVKIYDISSEIKQLALIPNPTSSELTMVGGGARNNYLSGTNVWNITIDYVNQLILFYNNDKISIYTTLDFINFVLLKSFDVPDLISIISLI